MIKLIFTILLMFYFYCNWERTEQSESGNHYPSQEEIQKIKYAIPNQPVVQPLKPRRVLIFSISWGYKHDMIPYGKVLFRFIGEKTGVYQPIISDDISMFEPQNLNKFDVVIFNNTNNEIFLPEDFDSLSNQKKSEALKIDQELKENFVNYLSGGKGLVVLHAGVASFRKWPEFGKIVGARFDNHPWVSGSTVTVKVEEPDHPLVQSFPNKHFQVTDEIYQVKAPYTRKELRVLLSLDTSQTDMTVNNIHRADRDFALSWIKKYGQGRVFYCAFGHQQHIYWNQQIVQHLLAGIQYASGDLQVDDSPSL